MGEGKKEQREKFGVVIMVVGLSGTRETHNHHHHHDEDQGHRGGDGMVPYHAIHHIVPILTTRVRVERFFFLALSL